MSSSSVAALSYEEPEIVTILILSSFLLLLNATSYILDRIVYCGLIGQIFVGIAWGTPGAQWLSRDVENAVMQLGYLGLILIVYEGGLSTNLKTLRANLFLSATVALIGTSAPIGISFILQAMLDATPLQAFAAGAALCSTSLGTIFTVLSTSGLTESRLGVVLTSAAMMDDVVGLVMVQVIANLGGAASSFSAVTVVRPVLVSIAFAVVIPLLCMWVIKPLTVKVWPRILNSKSGRMRQTFASKHSIFVLHTLVLVAMVTGSSYAGTSNLFASYLAGAAVTWWDNLRNSIHEPVSDGNQATAPSTAELSPRPASSAPSQPQAQTTTAGSEPLIEGSSGLHIYEYYFHPAVRLVLKPFFFGSIGFSIPITQMFSGGVIWRGFVYAVLMVLGKGLCGLALIRVGKENAVSGRLRGLWKKTFQSTSKGKKGQKKAQSNSVQLNPIESTPAQEATTQQNKKSAANQRRKRSSAPKPLSLYPAGILGCAMVARGEIGFLISSVAQANGIYESTISSTPGQIGSPTLFLVVTWAILICTLLGPVSVGLLVKRVKRLQGIERERNVGKQDPLGMWGVAMRS